MSSRKLSEEERRIIRKEIKCGDSVQIDWDQIGFSAPPGNRVPNGIYTVTSIRLCRNCDLRKNYCNGKIGLEYDVPLCYGYSKGFPFAKVFKKYAINNLKVEDFLL